MAVEFRSSSRLEEDLDGVTERCVGEQMARGGVIRPFEFAICPLPPRVSPTV